MDEFTIDDGKEAEIAAPMFGCFKRKFKWMIKEVSKMPKDDNIRKISPTFKIDPLSTWHAELSRNEDIFFLYIVCDCETFNSTVLYNLSISDSKKTVIYRDFGKGEYHSEKREHDLIHKNMKKCKEELLTAPNNELLFTVHLELTTSVGQLPIKVPVPPNIMQSLPADIKSFLEDSMEITTKKPLTLATMIASSYFFRTVMTDDAEEESNSPSLKKLRAYMDSRILKHADVGTILTLYHISRRINDLDLKENCKQSLLPLINADNIEEILSFMVE